MAELMRRYVVMAMATDGPFDTRDPEGAFVLRPWKDPAAVHALRAYADRCYPELARDLAGWIRVIEKGPVVRGDVGRRNEAHARAAAPAAPRTAAPASPRAAAPAAPARAVAPARKARPAKRRPHARKTARAASRKRR
jgi:hypothetical protein